jgi:DNA-directed RNA polymerase subunit omega
MNRSLVEGCLKKVQDPFFLVMLAAYRAQELASGSPSLIPLSKNKEAVLALREISEGKMDIPEMRESLIQSFQRCKMLSLKKFS